MISVRCTFSVYLMYLLLLYLILIIFNIIIQFHHPISSFSSTSLSSTYKNHSMLKVLMMSHYMNSTFWNISICSFDLFLRCRSSQIARHEIGSYSSRIQRTFFIRQLRSIQQYDWQNNGTLFWELVTLNFYYDGWISIGNFHRA